MNFKTHTEVCLLISPVSLVPFFSSHIPGSRWTGNQRSVPQHVTNIRSQYVGALRFAPNPRLSVPKTATYSYVLDLVPEAESICQSYPLM